MPALWEEFDELTTINGLRQPPNGSVISDISTISAETLFHAQLAQLSYQNDNEYLGYVSDIPNYIYHPRRWYNSDTNIGTYGSYQTLTQDERKVLYEKHVTGIDGLVIYTPINVNNVISTNLYNDIPIYVIFRGTNSIWDIFKDVNLLYNYTTNDSLDMTNFNAKVSAISSYLVNQIFNSYSENVVFISHSLGCKIALDVMHGFKGNTQYIDRIKHNVMFNPFILIDDVYNDCLISPTDFQAKIESYIIDGDFASIIYKNHPIGFNNIFGNIVQESSWITEIQNLTRPQYLNIANHSLNAFTNGVLITPATIHYEPIQSAERQIASLRTYSLTNYDEALTQENIYLMKEPSNTEWSVGNINIDSNHIENYDFEIQIAGGSSGKLDMIYIHGNWSYPLYFGTKVNGVTTFDTSNVFYAVKAFNEQSEQTYYIIGIENGVIQYYRTKLGSDYSDYLKTQEDGGANAFILSTESELALAQALGQNSLTHQKYRWTIQIPELPIHTGYGGGLRRSLGTLTYNHFVNTDYSIFNNYETTDYTIEPVNAVGRTLQSFTNDGIGSYVFKDANGDPVYNGIGMLPSLYPTESPGNTWNLTNLVKSYSLGENRTIDYILADIVTTDSTAFSLSSQLGSWEQNNFNTFNPIISTFSGIIGNKVKLIPATYSDPTIGVVGNVIPDTYHIQSGQGYYIYHDLTAFSSTGMDPALWKESMSYPVTDDGYKWKFII